MNETLLKVFGTLFILAFVPVMLVSAKNCIVDYMRNDDETSLAFFFSCAIALVIEAVVIILIWTTK